MSYIFYLIWTTENFLYKYLLAWRCCTRKRILRRIKKKKRRKRKKKIHVKVYRKDMSAKSACKKAKFHGYKATFVTTFRFFFLFFSSSFSFYLVLLSPHIVYLFLMFSLRATTWNIQYENMIRF